MRGAIVAIGEDEVIGVGGSLPWHYSEDLKRFKRVTLGAAVVMGRKTWESIGRPLPGRQNIVISRNPDYPQQGFNLCSSLQEAIEVAQSHEVMVIGGGELYRQAMPVASRMVLTLVDFEPQADTWFPEWDTAEWLELSRQPKPADQQNRYACEVLRLQRIQLTPGSQVMFRQAVNKPEAH